MTASHAFTGVWIKFTSRWTRGLGMLFWQYPTLPPCRVRGLYCAALNLLPSLHVCVCFWLSVCVCVTQLGWTLKHCPSTNGPWKTHRLGHLSSAIMCWCVRVCVLWLFVLFFFFEWKSIVYSKFVTRPEAVSPSEHAHTDLSSGWLNGLGRASENLEDAGEKDNGDCNSYWKRCKKGEQGREESWRTGRLWEGRVVNSLWMEGGNDGNGKQNKAVNVFVEQPLSVYSTRATKRFFGSLASQAEGMNYLLKTFNMTDMVC